MPYVAKNIETGAILNITKNCKKDTCKGLVYAVIRKNDIAKRKSVPKSYDPIEDGYEIVEYTGFMVLDLAKDNSRLIVKLLNNRP